MKKQYLILRSLSGISGDMMMTGLARLSGLDGAAINALIRKIGIRQLNGSLVIKKVFVGQVAGWRARITLKPEHSHRTFRDICGIISSSRLSGRAKRYAKRAFTLLAKAEADVHGLKPSEVVFHEIGGLDSILDICLSAALLDAITPAKFICSPLPVCDGVIRCAHGVLPCPAPAVQRLLAGVPVYGLDSEGETITPTGIALLKAFGAKFGRWPAVTIQKTAHVYGTRTLPRVPNGSIFTLGT